MFSIPSISTLFIIFVVLSTIGIILDSLVLSSRLDQWRKNLALIMNKLYQPGAKSLIIDVNKLYCDLFDHIYGLRHFSKHRFIASIISSYFGVIVLTLIFQSDVLAKTDIFLRNLLYIFVLGGLLNLIPDFISLIETRFILNKSRGKGYIGIFFLLIADLLLTTLIFFIALACMFFLLSLIENVFDVDPAETFISYINFLIDNLLDGSFELLFSSEMFFVFLFTTYITSFFWILFVITFILITIFHKLSPIAEYIYKEVGQSSKPATAIAGYLNGMIIVVYMIMKLLE
tara:strand:+ start:164 stop:1027 length:864 start_codon:yes stop_codon:yes gene_type:complete